jgi:hypothetical protein
VVVVVLLLLLLPANECQAARQRKLWKHRRRFAKSQRRGEAYPTGVKKEDGRKRDGSGVGIADKNAFVALPFPALSQSHALIYLVGCTFSVLAYLNR